MTPLRKILEELNLKTKEAYKYRIDNKDDGLQFTYDDKAYIDLAHQQILALLPKKKDIWSGLPLTKMVDSHGKTLDGVLLQQGHIHDYQAVGFNQAISDMEQSMTGER